MATKKIRIQDMVDNSIGSDQIIDGNIKLAELKRIGGSDNVSAATLSYDGINLTPTIKDTVDSIIAATGFTFDKWTSSAAQTDYVLSGSVQFDTTKLLLVFYNGQLLKQGISDDYQIITTTLTDDTIRFNWTPETGYEIYTVFEKL